MHLALKQAAFTYAQKVEMLAQYSLMNAVLIET